jgi:hypothetical protein
VLKLEVSNETSTSSSQKTILKLLHHRLMHEIKSFVDNKIAILFRRVTRFHA